MQNSKESNQLVPIQPLKFSTGEAICKINLSGLSVDEYKMFNPDGYTIICNLQDLSNGLEFHANTSLIIFNTDQEKNFVQNYGQLIPDVAKEMGVNEEVALEKVGNFFSNSVVRVEPTGIQGRVYKTMKGLQNYIPFSYTIESVSLLKTTGITGLKIISNAPLTFVGVTYVGAAFFGYVGSVAGDNMLGVGLNATSYLLSRPMRGLEIVVNGLILGPISNTIGLPLILNGTQEILAGKGLSFQESVKIGLAFERMCNSKLVKKGKKIYQILRNKED